MRSPARGYSRHSAGGPVRSELSGVSPGEEARVVHDVSPTVPVPSGRTFSVRCCSAVPSSVPGVGPELSLVLLPLQVEEMSECVGSALIQKGFKAAPDQYIGIFAQNRPEVMPGLPRPRPAFPCPLPRGPPGQPLTSFLLLILQSPLLGSPCLSVHLSKLCSCKGQLSYLPRKVALRALSHWLVLLIIFHTCLSSPSTLHLLSSWV